MSLRGLLPGPDPLRTRRRKRIVDQASRNGRFPTAAWRYLVPAADTLVGTGPWPTGVSDGEGLIHGSLDQLVDEVIRPASAADGGKQAAIGLLVEPAAAELAAAAAALDDEGRLVVELHPSRLHTVSDVRERLDGADLAVDEVYTISPSEDGWQPTLWFPTSGPGPVLELLRAETTWPGRGRVQRLARAIAIRGARLAPAIAEHEYRIPSVVFDGLINDLDEAAEMLVAISGLVFVLAKRTVAESSQPANA